MLRQAASDNNDAKRLTGGKATSVLTFLWTVHDVWRSADVDGVDGEAFSEICPAPRVNQRVCLRPRGVQLHKRNFIVKFWDLLMNEGVDFISGVK